MGSVPVAPAPASAEVIALRPQQETLVRVRELLKFRWSWVEAVNSDARLTDSVARIGIAAICFLNRVVDDPRFGTLWPSPACLAKEVGSGVSTAKRALQILKTLDYLEVIHPGGGRKTTVFRPTLPGQSIALRPTSDTPAVSLAGPCATLENRQRYPSRLASDTPAVSLAGPELLKEKNRNEPPLAAAAADELAATAGVDLGQELAERLGDAGDVLRRRIREDVFIASFSAVEVLKLDRDAGVLILGVPSEKMAKELEWHRPDICAAWNVTGIEFRLERGAA